MKTIDGGGKIVSGVFEKLKLMFHLWVIILKPKQRLPCTMSMHSKENKRDKDILKSLIFTI